jgi:hypothetical protein
LESTKWLRNGFYWLYSSKTLFGVLLAVLINPFFPNSLQYSFAIVLAVWLFAILVLKHKVSSG